MALVVSSSIAAGDAEAGQATITAYVYLQPTVNNSPEAIDDAYTVDQGDILSVAAPGVLNNDTDIEEQPLTAHIVSEPLHGILALNADGSFTYTHDGSASRQESFEYVAYDGSAYSEPATVTISVNLLPVSVAGSSIATGSTIFSGASDSVCIAAGEVSNDTNTDLVVSRWQEGGAGQMALFQRSVTGAWNVGNVIKTQGEGIIEPSIGILKHNGARWLGYAVFDADGSHLEAARLGGVNVMESLAIGGASTGRILPVIGDVDGDAKYELYALSETAPSALVKYLYGSGGFSATIVAETPEQQITGWPPLIGHCGPAGNLAVVYESGPHSLHVTSYTATGYSDAQIYTDTEPLNVRAVGSIDNNEGDDVIIARGDSLVLVSGGMYAQSTLVSGLAEPVTTLTCADLNGDGQDEVYAGDALGGIYTYTPTDGYQPLETVEEITWHDSARAVWTGDALEEVVFAGLDSTGKLTIKTYGEDYDKDGLSDNAEARLDTDPDDPDSDDDAFLDGEEVAVGTNPLDPQSYPLLLAGQPWEYTYALNQGDVEIADTIPERDALQMLAGADVVRFADGPIYTGIHIGSEGADSLIGGTANDVFFCFGGDDYVRGYNGIDLLIGGDGPDRLYGDNGDDIILAGPGNDRCYPGTGTDTILCGDGNDLLTLADPDAAPDTFDGGQGSDKLLLPVQGYSSFTLLSPFGFESFEGGNGHDYIDWSSAAVSVTVRGNGGNDTLIGGSSNDILMSGAGHDTVRGNAGDDAVTLSDADSNADTVDGGEGLHDRLIMEPGYVSFSMSSPCGFEEYSGTAGDDLIDWSSAAARVALYGNGGNDVLYAGSANDDLVTLVASPTVSPQINGGGGLNDQLLIQSGDFAIVGSCGFEKFTGGPGYETVDWTDATVAVTLRGNGGNDTLRGGSMNDLITGGPGNDVLYGGSGADVLYGDAGVNHLIGEGGNDSLRGGGSDYAHFQATPAPPRYNVRDVTSYIVVTDTTGTDGIDIVRGCPITNLAGPYLP